MCCKKKKFIVIFIITMIILSNLILLKNVYASEIPLPYGFPKGTVNHTGEVFTIIKDVNIAVSIISIALGCFTIIKDKNKIIEILKFVYCLINLFITFNLLNETYIFHWFILIGMLLIQIVILIQGFLKILKNNVKKGDA